MSLRLPYPNVYKFLNNFSAPDQGSPEQTSRSQGLRKSGPRSKTGCSTCKQRRVKCDETKPQCIRCQNLGRECGGYAPEQIEDVSKQNANALVPIHPRPMSVMSYTPSVAIHGDQFERRYFQRFCEKTAAEICGSFDPTFWTEKVPQLCHQDAPIRYATIALGALAKSLEITSSPTRLSLSGFPQVDHHNLDEHHRFALREYSRAIASLRIILSDGRRHLRTSLTALVDDLGRLFARLDVQGLFIPPPYPVPNLLQDDMDIPDEFDSVQEAREVWDFLMAAIGQFHTKYLIKSQTEPEQLSTPYWNRIHNHYTTQLLRWRKAFQSVHAEEAHTGSISADATHMLSIYYNIATILVASSVPHTEMLYDEYNHLFAEIICKAQILLSSPDDPSNTSRFTLDMGTILPLVITARGEKVFAFDTISVARICAWISSIEGEGIQEDDQPIPESSRWTISYLHLNSEERWLAVQLTLKHGDNGNHSTEKQHFLGK
ncbi:C6 zinc finger domain protein [Botrytis cinerea]